MVGMLSNGQILQMQIFAIEYALFAIAARVWDKSRACFEIGLYTQIIGFWLHQCMQRTRC